jgi:hypothetical protein
MDRLAHLLEATTGGGEAVKAATAALEEEQKGPGEEDRCILPVCKGQAPLPLEESVLWLMCNYCSSSQVGGSLPRKQVVYLNKLACVQGKVRTYHLVGKRSFTPLSCQASAASCWRYAR